MVKLPKEWEKHPLDLVASIQTGLAKGKKGLSNPVSLPYLRVANVQDGYFDLSEIKYIEIEDHQIGRYSLQDKDVLLTEGGDFDKLGRGSIWRKQFEPCLHQNHVFVVRTNPKKLIPEFFTCLSSSDYGKAYFLSCSKQSTNLASINSTQLKGFPVIVPPLEEQHKIVNILSTRDHTIEQVTALLEAKREQKRALMQRLLTGKQRFPEFAGQPLHVELLGDFIEEVTERNKDQFITRVLSVTNHSGFVLPEEQFSRRVASENVSNYKIVRKGQFAYNPSRINVGSLARLQQYNDGILSPMYVIFKHDAAKLDAEFLWQWLNSSEAKKRIIASTQGSVRDSVGYNTLASFSLKVPSLPEQRKIAAVLSAADREIDQLTQKLNAYKQQKKGLMQQLLTGKKRVKLKRSDAA